MIQSRILCIVVGLCGRTTNLHLLRCEIRLSLSSWEFPGTFGCVNVNSLASASNIETLLAEDEVTTWAGHHKCVWCDGSFTDYFTRWSNGILEQITKTSRPLPHWFEVAWLFLWSWESAVLFHHNLWDGRKSLKCENSCKKKNHITGRIL